MRKLTLERNKLLGFRLIREDAGIESFSSKVGQPKRPSADSSLGTKISVKSAIDSKISIKKEL